MIAIAKLDMCGKTKICPTVIIIIIHACPVPVFYSSKGYFANHMIKTMVPLEDAKYVLLLPLPTTHLLDLVFVG